ncbi:MAG: hypothetical protein Q7K39_03870 [Candidatus Magasanikbacteria bacterium]|nr:hypothetical protein [Candidatus Magasanikbacteria bacterium]
MTAGRWSTFSLAEQLGNVGSEVGRAAIRERSGDTAQRDRALERALELLDLTIADSRWQKRLKEICRAREVLCDTFWGKREYHSTPEAMEKYFYHFALLARCGL